MRHEVCCDAIVEGCRSGLTEERKGEELQTSGNVKKVSLRDRGEAQQGDLLAPPCRQSWSC